MLPVRTLLAVFRLLPSRAAAVCPRDVLLLLGLGLNLALVRVFAFATPTEVDAVLKD